MRPYFLILTILPAVKYTLTNGSLVRKIICHMSVFVKLIFVSTYTILLFPICCFILLPELYQENTGTISFRFDIIPVFLHFSILYSCCLELPHAELLNFIRQSFHLFYRILILHIIR